MPEALQKKAEEIPPFCFWDGIFLKSVGDL